MGPIIGSWAGVDEKSNHRAKCERFGSWKNPWVLRFLIRNLISRNRMCKAISTHVSYFDLFWNFIEGSKVNKLWMILHDMAPFSSDVICPHKQTLVARLLFSNLPLIQRFMMMSGLVILFHRIGRCWQFRGWFPSLKLGGTEHALWSVARQNPCWNYLRGADESSAGYFRTSSGCAVLFYCSTVVLLTTYDQ